MVGVALVVGVAVARVAVRARLAASKRRREAGEPGRRCARRERWAAPEGGRVSLAVVGRPGAVTERGTGVVVGEGLEGLGHLEEGSGQMGLLGWEVPPRGDGRSLSLEVGFGSGGGADGVMALRWGAHPGL